MRERLSEEAFLEDLQSYGTKKEIRRFTRNEKRYWENHYEVNCRRELFQKKKVCLLALNPIENIYYIIAALIECKKVKIIGTDKESVRVNYSTEDEAFLFLDAKELNPEIVFYLKGIEERHCITNKPRPPRISENLNDYQPIDRSLVDYEKYMTHIGQAMVNNCLSVQFSRGCHFNCAYCQKVYLSKYRNRSAESLFEELSMYYKIGVKRFAFVDDLPNFNKKEGIRFLKMLYESKMRPQLFFPNGIRGDILDKEYIDYMVQAGTVNIDLALETASPRLQKLINKNLNIEKLRENIEYIIKYYPDVILELQMMIGIPTETCEEALSSLSFIKDLRWIDFPYMHILKIYPNTPMAELAMKNGISEEAIAKSNNLGYHELPETLPFSKMFVKKCQSDFLNNYVLDNDRLKTVIRKQEKILTEKEMIQKYNSYLPMKVNCIDDLKKITGIEKIKCVDESEYRVENLNKKIEKINPSKDIESNSVRMLFLDITFDPEEADKIYHVVEAPLGQMYLLSYLKKTLGSKIDGKILKPGIDYTTLDELEEVIREYNPDFIGIRGMNYYKYNIHYSIGLIRQWGFTGLLAVGGPYATSYYQYLLNDKDIDFAMIGEGEETLLSIAKCILNNEQEKIQELPGVVFRQDVVKGRENIFLINY